MPVDPVSRAQFRLALHRIERDWYGIAAKLDKQGPGSPEAPRLRGELRDLIVQTADFVRNKPYFVSDELSLVDVTLAPILWRLTRYRIELPKDSVPLLKYAKLLFSRPAFLMSLSPQEREMRLA
jgi:RNA polymerase-associated protein